MTTNNTPTKLDHNTLAALFRQHSRREEASVAELLQRNEASEQRIALAEKLAHDRLACQAMQLAEDLRPWSQAISGGLSAENRSATNSSHWWKPSFWLATGLTCAIAVAVLVANRHSPAQLAPDVFFAGHFDAISAPGQKTGHSNPPGERTFRGSFDPPSERSLFKSRFEGRHGSQDTA